MEIPREYFRLNELAERWGRSEVDILHMASSGTIAIYVWVKALLTNIPLVNQGRNDLYKIIAAIDKENKRIMNIPRPHILSFVGDIDKTVGLPSLTDVDGKEWHASISHGSFISNPVFRRSDFLIKSEQVYKYEDENPGIRKGDTCTAFLAESKISEEKAIISKKDTLLPSERKSLIKLVFAMAVDCYGYDPNDKKSPVTKDILEAASKADISIDAGTIVKWLKEGAALRKNDF